MKTIIVGAIKGYAWRKIEPWYKSLRMTGFDGEVHMLFYPTPPGRSPGLRNPSPKGRGELGEDQALRRMEKEGIQVHTCEMTARQVVVSRFNDLAKICVTFEKDAWVVFPDVGDLVFQTNPEEFLARLQNGTSVVAASEGVTFSGNRWVRENLEHSFPEHYDAMISERLYNAGSVAARAGLFARLAADVYWMCMAKTQAVSHDQAAMNILLRNEQYRKHVLFTRANDGWCFNGASSIFAKGEDRVNYLEKLPVLKGGKCYVEAGLACMFHHYTRDEGTKKRVLRWVNE